MEQNNETNIKEIEVDYVYMTIPAEYVCIYQRLLVYLADLGKIQIDDCTSTCKGDGKNIITCWNLFQSAIACYNLERKKEAEFFIDYIKNQIANIYDKDANGLIPFNNMIPVSISEDGKLKAIVGCGDSIKFYVDHETGSLYQKSNTKNTTNNIIEIDNNNLVNKDK